MSVYNSFPHQFKVYLFARLSQKLVKKHILERCKIERVNKYLYKSCGELLINKADGGRNFPGWRSSKKLSKHRPEEHDD